MKVWPSKDPDEQLRFTYDWSPDLAPGEILTDTYSVVQIAAAGTVLVETEHDDTSVTIVVAGGADGQEAEFQIRVLTTLQNTFEDEVLLPIARKIAPVIYPGGLVPPTIYNLVAVFPEFADLPPTQLQYYLDRAATFIDPVSWQAADFGHARMLLAAHFLTLGGLGNSIAARDIASGFDQFRSMSVGTLSISRLNRSETLQAGRTSSLELAATRYGRELIGLIRRNKGGPRVTGGGQLVSRGDGDRSQSPTYPWGG